MTTQEFQGRMVPCYLTVINTVLPQDPGFIHPKFIIDLLAQDDSDGFYDRILICCPPELVVPFKELKVPMPIIIILWCIQIYKGLSSARRHDYVQVLWSDDAQAKFADMHNELQDSKSKANDDNRRGHLIKAIAKLIRLSGIIHVVELAFQLIHNCGCAEAWMEYYHRPMSRNSG